MTPCPSLRRRALAAILLVAALVRVLGVTGPWGEDFRGWGGAFYSMQARTFIEHGYLPTNFIGVRDPGPPPYTKHSMYFKHPPMLAVLLSLVYRITGIHEWAGRLIPIVFSLGCLVLLYDFARRGFGERVALGATAIAAVIPMAGYYGAHVDVPLHSVGTPLVAQGISGNER